MVKTVLLVLALIPLGLCGQTRYALRQIDFQDPVNSEICKPHSDNLAVILVDGYLNGKLAAYKISPLDSLIHSIEFQKRSVRETADAGNRRSDKKKSSRKKSFGKSKTEVEITVADMEPLSKSDFLKQMVIVEDDAVQWDKSTKYERGKGLVFYKGVGYFPMKDGAGVTPPNKTYWEPAYNANIPFYFHIPELPAVTIFGQYVTVDRKETWQPLLVRITRTAEVPDYLVDMSVSFKFDDVLRYLSAIGQPLLYNEPTGYVGGGTFILNDDERFALKERIRTEATNPTLKPSIAIESTILYTSFLDKSDKDPLCTIFQDPSGKEFRVFKENIPVATIPTGAVEQVLSFPKANVMTWSQALSQDLFNKYEIQLKGLSSDLPFKEVLAMEAIPNPRRSFFLEKYTISTVGATEQKRLRSRFTNLTKMITTQFKAGTLLPAEEKDSWFRARYDWSTVPEVKAIGGTIPKPYWSNLLHHDDISDVRYPYYWSDNANVSYLHKKMSPLRVDSLEFGVTYKRTVAPDKNKTAYEPYQVSLHSMQNPGADGPDFPTYTFNWTDLKKAIVKGKDPLLVELMKLIETAALPYTDSRIIYGVIEEAPPSKAVAAKK